MSIAALVTVTVITPPAFMLAPSVLAQGAPQTVQLTKLDVVKIATGYRASKVIGSTRPARMDALVEEFGHSTFVSFPVIAARLLLAALLDAAIGFEREWRQRPAGLRTHILICVAAGTFGVLTIEIVHAPMFGREAVAVDPIRAVEAVTAGVAFLAAGTILLARGEVQGLTTGAGMWLAGAVGLSCGLGLWQIAGFGTLLILIVLGLLHTFEVKLGIAADKKRDEELRQQGKARPAERKAAK